VEVKARLVQRFKGRRVVDRGQANQSPVVQIRPHASAFAGLEQLSQSTVPKAFDHTAGDVNRGLTSVKSGFTDRTSLRRLYAEERLQVRRRGGRKRALGTRAPLALPQGPNQRWSLDFLHDQLNDGRRFRILAILDDFTRECLALVADTSLSGLRVGREFDAIIAERGKPIACVSDNTGPPLIDSERECPRIVAIAAVAEKVANSVLWSVVTMKIDDIAQIPPDPPLAEELSDDDVIFEMANLDKSQTGIDGFVWISTLMTGHAPRVKYFIRPGRTQPSFSVMISDHPRVVANSLPARTVSQMAPLVIRWVSLNKDALLDFWHHGDTWPAAQLISFLQNFQRI